MDRSFPWFARQADPAPMNLHGQTAEIETQAGADQGILLVGDSGVLLKNSAVLRWLDPGALILHIKFQPLFTDHPTAAKTDRSVVRTITQGIGKQILQHPQNENPIQSDSRQIRLNLQNQFHLLDPGHTLDGAQTFGQHGTGLDHLLDRNELAVFNLADAHQV